MKGSTEDKPSIQRVESCKFKDDWEKTLFKKDVEYYASLRIRENRPEDKNKSSSSIHAEVYMNIYNHWLMLRNGHVFDFPITDLI